LTSPLTTSISKPATARGYLKSYPFGYILISHDRYFLDVTIDRTVEIWNSASPSITAITRNT